MYDIAPRAHLSILYWFCASSPQDPTSVPSAVVPATAPPAEHSEPVPLAENVPTEAAHADV